MFFSGCTFKLLCLNCEILVREFDLSCALYNNQFKRACILFCVCYPNNVIIGHLNINSIRNKFEMLQFLLTDYIDISMSESKLDGTFPSSQFQIYGFRTLYRLDRNDRGGGILFVKENLMTRLLL